MEGQMELFHNYVLYIQRNQNKHNYIQKLPTKPMLFNFCVSVLTFEYRSKISKNN